MITIKGFLRRQNEGKSSDVIVWCAHIFTHCIHVCCLSYPYRNTWTCKNASQYLMQQCEWLIFSLHILPLKSAVWPTATCISHMQGEKYLPTLTLWYRGEVFLTTQNRTFISTSITTIYFTMKQVRFGNTGKDWLLMLSSCNEVWL